MQIALVPETIVMIAFFATCILITIYISVKTCIGGAPIRPERHGGTPRADDLTVSSSSYGFETSYSPADRASSSGALPVGGRVERSPTRSFSSYTNPRMASKKQESKSE
jgi:hypothetical protein